ncbi:MAG: hypothetical protein HPY69_09945 [Armatimonadetes bacterium]|nr:hypothetical protein [Armatimonadota bacterium]
MPQPSAVALTLLLVLTLCAAAPAKECSRLVTADMRARALRNAERYPWVADWQREVTRSAEPWVQLSDEELWGLVTSQELPRAAYIAAGILYEGKPDACPSCGKPIGYSGVMDFWKHDWKVGCPNCKEQFPKNDFRAFYQSALDEHGCFRRELGDRSLLYNAEHPDPNDPDHKLWVDDGYGLTDSTGNVHHFIAYYNQWAQWASIFKAVESLSLAYAATSDRRYAHKAAVLLDRIADVYPEMDYYPLGRMGFQHSHGGTLHGRIEGNIWEAFRAESLARGYDLIFDGIQGDDSLVRFCTTQSARYQLGDKNSVAAVCRHIEDHLLQEVFKSVQDGRIDGNTGMTHTCLATAAIALDRPGMTEQWLDWLFDPEYPVTNPNYPRTKDPVPWVMTQGLDRDGMGGECGGYGLIWSRGMLDLAEILAAYPPYSRHDMVREYPQLRQAVLVEARLNVLDAVMPNIGDTGACGSWGRAGDVTTFVRGYRLMRDPRMAVWAWRRAGGQASRLRVLPASVFDEDPEALAAEIQRVGAEAFRPLESDFMGRYGQAYLQTEATQDGRAISLHFGYNKGHSHHDCLTLGLWAHNVDMLPDHGYPEFTGAWPQRIAWTSNTSSHNTVVVDDQRSAYSPGGKLELFAIQTPLRVMQVASPTAYGDKLEAYRRTVALVDVSETDSYVLDVFRVRGGSTHRMMTCGAASEAALEGLSLTPQPTGTFAGPEVEFTTTPGPGESNDSTSGFSYLFDVARSGGPVNTPYRADWRIEDARGRIRDGHGPHLRLHALNPCDEVALASGQPPQNHTGNPKSLRYLIQSRFGENLRSQFVSVLEPYDTTPFIRSVRALAVETDAAPDTVVAVEVQLADGRSDMLICCEQPSRVRIAADTEFYGLYGMVRRQGDRVTALRLTGGTLLRAGNVSVTCRVAAWTGVVREVDVSDPADNGVILDPPLPPDAVVEGQPIHFANALPYDTSYFIRGVDGARVSTGDITLVAGFRNPKDFTAGYTYQVNPGDRYTVHCLAGFDR